jgi:hypothetical protein
MSINDLMDDLGREQKETLVSGDNKPLRQIIDDILTKDEKKKRRLSEG